MSFVARAHVVEIHRRLILGDHQRIEAAVVVEIRDDQASTDVELLEWRPGLGGHVGKATAGLASEQLGAHGVRKLGPEVVDMPVGGEQVEPAVVVGIQKSGPETEEITAGRCQPGGGRVVDEEALAQVVKEAGRFAVIVRDGQVDQAVAIHVAARHSHTCLVAAGGIRGHTGLMADFLESKSTKIVEQEISRAVVGHEHVGPAVAVEVGCDDSQATAVAVNDARVCRHIDEPTVVVAEDVVAFRFNPPGIAGDDDPAGRVLADEGVFGVPGSVMADVEVKISVAIEIGESRGRGQSRSPDRPTRAVASSKVPSPRLR